MKKMRMPVAEKEKSYIVTASVLRRVIAFIIDLLIINLAAFGPLRRLLANYIPLSESFADAYAFIVNNGNIINIICATIIVMTLLAVLYFVAMESMLGQTPGKMFFNLYVISLKDNKGRKTALKKPGFLQCLLRSIFLVPFFPFVILWIVDPVYLLFNRNRQRFTEYLGKTKVVQVHHLRWFNGANK